MPGAVLGLEGPAGIGTGVAGGCALRCPHPDRRHALTIRRRRDIRRSCPAVLPVVIQQRARRGVLRLDGVVVALERGRDLQGELLAELDPHWSNELTPQTTPCVKVMCS